MYKIPEESPIKGILWADYVARCNGPQRRSSCLTMRPACEAVFLTLAEQQRGREFFEPMTPAMEDEFLGRLPNLIDSVLGRV